MKTAQFQLKKTAFRIAGTYREGNYDRDLDEQCRLFVDGVELSLAESLNVRNHSPSGFNWGYGGSGPAQSALAICLHIFQNRYVAEGLYQRFKEAFVVQWQPQKTPFDYTVDVADFLIDNHRLLQEAAEREAQDEEMNGWGLVEEAEQLLNPSADDSVDGPAVVSPVRPELVSRYQVGDVVRINTAFLDSSAGDRAVVYELYEWGGISIITEHGDDLGGFDAQDQEQYLEFLYHADGFSYTFRSVSYLYADWRRGSFLGVFR